MRILVGSTGFVGGNLYASGQFDAAYHSTDVSNAFGTRPELLVYAGLPAEKYLANAFPKQDLAKIRQAEENIRQIAPEKLVLISTIDVFARPQDVDEKSPVATEHLGPYGYHRYQLECWVREHSPDALVIRLPGLYGRGLKKNFLYDYLHRVPSLLSAAKFQELAEKDAELSSYYVRQDNGFYRVRELSDRENTVLREKFQALGFSALHFTDSRSRYQFYHLSHLWEHMQTALAAGLTLWHPATEPVSAGEIYRYLTGEEFCNELTGTPANYNYRTAFAEIFGGQQGYIQKKAEVLAEIQRFIEGYAEEEGRVKP